MKCVLVHKVSWKISILVIFFLLDYIYLIAYKAHSGPEILKESRQKKTKKLVKSNIVKKIFFQEIAFLVVLNFFPVQKLIFEIANSDFTKFLK